MPGYHSPQKHIELFAGLEIKAGDTVLTWRRDPVEVYAFQIDVPEGTDTLDIGFQFLSPTTENQGDVVVTQDIINLQWGRTILYPAGYYSRGIEVEVSVTLPDGWLFATVLELAAQEGPRVRFAFSPTIPTTLPYRPSSITGRPRSSPRPATSAPGTPTCPSATSSPTNPPIRGMASSAAPPIRGRPVSSCRFATA